MPTSKVRAGIRSSIIDMLVPLGMAAVMPTILSLRSASSTSVLPNTSCHFNGCGLPLPFTRSPVSSLNLPGACHVAGSASAGA